MKNALRDGAHFSFSWFSGFTWLVPFSSGYYCPHPCLSPTLEECHAECLQHLFCAFTQFQPCVHHHMVHAVVTVHLVKQQLESP